MMRKENKGGGDVEDVQAKVKSYYVTCADFQKAMTPMPMNLTPVPVPRLRCFDLDVATRFIKATLPTHGILQVSYGDAQ